MHSGCKDLNFPKALLCLPKPEDLAHRWLLISWNLSRIRKLHFFFFTPFFSGILGYQREWRGGEEFSGRLNLPRVKAEARHRQSSGGFRVLSKEPGGSVFIVERTRNLAHKSSPSVLAGTMRYSLSISVFTKQR